MQRKMYKILIVEDDFTIASTLKQYFESWGYIAERVTDFEHVTAQFAEFNPQLVIMDISLPYYNGFHWCGEIRKLSQVPVLFLSSASDNANIIMAISQGGDDFIQKPFDLNVLMAKIQALLRRAYDFSARSELSEHNGAVLDLSAAVISCNGGSVELTKNELGILSLLFANKGKVISRDAIMTKLWTSDSFIDDNTLTVNITRLRKKLADIGVDCIATKKGVGYYLK